MIISISGIDGSGKTTIAKALYNLYKDNKINISYKKEFDLFLLNIVRKLFKGDKVENLKTEVVLNNKKSLKSQLIYFVYFIVVYLDFILEYIYYEILFKSKILIRERYIYDFGVSIYKNTNIKSYLYLIKIFPSSSFNFFLESNVNIIFNRIKNRDFVFPKKYYNDLSKKYYFYNKNYININGENDIEDIIHDIKNIIKIKLSDTIVLSGIDGAGKTTTINNIKKLLYKNNINYTEIHFYYNYIIIKIINKIKFFLGVKQKTVEELYKCSLEGEKKALKKKRNIFWIIFVLGDSLIQYMYIKIVGFNKIKLIDRFFPDYIISWNFIGVKYNKNIFKYLPKAKNYFLLVAPPEILYKRKPEHSLDFFNKCFNDYLKLSKEYNIILIDTSKYNEKQVLNIILSKLENKYGL